MNRSSLNVYLDRYDVLNIAQGVNKTTYSGFSVLRRIANRFWGV